MVQDSELPEWAFDIVSDIDDAAEDVYLESGIVWLYVSLPESLTSMNLCFLLICRY